ncbi:MAG: hypothetical protein IJ150_14330 [Bacteroidales bacterium]|nr:hypothetical protein [Bacteroidales bacterium]
MPIFETDNTLKSMAIQVIKMAFEYKDKGLKEFLEKNFVDIYNGARRRIISKKNCWIADLLKETKND